MDAREGYNQYALRLGLRLRVKRIDDRPDRESTDWDRNARHFRLTLSRGSRRMLVYYSQGSAHTKDPGMADLLDCFASDFSTYDNAHGFEAWADELGFDVDSRKAERTYRAIERQHKAFTRLVWDSSEALPSLYELERL